MLIENWKKAWKFWSVQLTTIGIFLLSFADVLNAAWASMAPSLSAHIPGARYVALGVFILSLIARLIDQGEDSGKQENP